MGDQPGKRTAVAAPSLRPRPVGRPMLVVIAGPELGRQIDLTVCATHEVDIGRGDEASVRIDGDLVSRRHASIQRLAGQLIVADLGSTNGTYVNEAKIRSHALSDGDQIRIGKVVLKYTECAIEAEYHDQVMQLASKDALTGAFNRRYFDGELRKQAMEARTQGSPLSLVALDIDHFKSINDGFGHAAGDAVLRQVSELVQRQLRAEDVFARTGGEEFVALMPGTDLREARMAAELTRGAIELTDFVVDGKKIPVTSSFGVAVLEAADDPAEKLLKRADERLYEAKHAGRNRVV